MITVHGPIGWPSVQALREALHDVPENGDFTLGGVRHVATEQLKRFRTNGIRTIEFTDSTTTARAWLREGCIVFARREQHSQGRDIIVLDGSRTTPGTFRNAIGRRWLRRDWWCKYHPSVAEYRVHIFEGMSIARGKKHYQPTTHPVSSEVVTAIEPPFPAIRSRRNGWLLRHDLRPPEAVRDAAKAAVAACGYLYGAVDILVSQDGNNIGSEDVVVLEVNRLPAMDDYTRERYVEAIRAYVLRHSTPAPVVTPPSRRSNLAVGGRPYEGYVIV